MKLNNKLRTLRQAKRMTMKKIATLIGIPVSTYRDWEYGSKVPAENVHKIAKIFQVSVSELFGIEVDLNKEKLICLLEDALDLVRNTR
jgi:transcriptional regulator with XRE-family HTH domain